MRRIFSNIRNKLLGEGKLIRYLTYAAGEIMLIIIGILFALQINNWNEDRKALQEFDTYVVQLEADVQRVINQNREISEFNREHATGLHSLIQFLEQPDYTDEELIEFEQRFRALGRHRLMQLDVGHFGELLNGNTEVISRDADLHQKTMHMISEIKVFQNIISSIEPIMVEERSKLSRFRGLDSRSVPEMPLRYDLDEIRNSKEFVNITQSIIAMQINMAGFLGGIVDKLEEYLGEIEGKESE